MYSYRHHLKNVHKIKTRAVCTPTLDITLNPDDNANNHCSSCNWTLSTKYVYRSHLKAAHKMTLPRLKYTRPTPNKNILPDISDPNLYCKSCQVKFKTLKLYRKHLRRVHGIALLSLGKRAISFDSTISSDDTQDQSNTTACAICKFQYSSKNNYNQHIKRFHGDGRDTPVDRRGINTVDHNISPDPNDPNFFLSVMPKSVYKSVSSP